ncbi:MAG: hypothetical protein K0S37_1189 [Microbacterium sp.]|jgi:hypothetical protein|nr:hypothetical protein [Microbacterium sp.]
MPWRNTPPDATLTSKTKSTSGDFDFVVTPLDFENEVTETDFENEVTRRRRQCTEEKSGLPNRSA